MFVCSKECPCAHVAVMMTFMSMQYSVKNAVNYYSIPALTRYVQILVQQMLLTVNFAGARLTFMMR